jgi:MraZ protein
MFLNGMRGEYRHQLDEKGRMRIPAKLKEMLGDSPVIMKGLSGKCLYMYSQENAERVLEKMMSDMDFFDEDTAEIARCLMPFTIVAEEDKQGRVTLTEPLINCAKLGKNIVTIGAYSRAEIWSEEAWLEHCAASDERFKISVKNIKERNAK